MASENDERTVEELKDELRSRGLPVSGNKAELRARLDEADGGDEEVGHALNFDDVPDPSEADVAQAQADEIREDEGSDREFFEDLDGDEDEDLTESDALANRARQEREAAEADPGLAHVLAVQDAAAEAAEEADEIDPSVQAMIDSLTAQAERLDEDGALRKLDEVGAQADVQQALMDNEANRVQPLAQRPVEAVDALREGAGAGIFVDTTLAEDEDIPGHVVRVQRRPGAPLSEEEADAATFPIGTKDRDEVADEEIFTPDEGEGPMIALPDRDPVYVEDREEDEDEGS